jgi:hypothetical protein
MMKRVALVLSALSATLVVIAGALVLALQAPRLPVPERQDWVFHDVVLVEAGSAPRPGSTLRIEDGAIAAVTRSREVEKSSARSPSAVAAIGGGASTDRTDTGDLAGLYVSPGLTDLHVHYPPKIAIGNVELWSLLLLAHGVTSIRQAAAEAELPVIGHAPHSVSFEEAGLVDLQHGTGAVVVDRERVGRSDFRAADWVTMDDARIAHVARVSLDQDIAHTPTLVNGRMRPLLAEGQPARHVMARDSGLRHLPRFWHAAWTAIWGPPFIAGDPESEALHELFRVRQAVMTAKLHQAGVRIHAGTDTLMPFVAPGSSLHGELADLVAAGIAPDDVWKLATREAGRSLGLPGLGTLEVGAPADLVFLRSNPSGNLAAFQEIVAVLADGRLYRRADLDAMLAATDAHFHGALYSGVTDAVVALLKSQFAPDHDGTRNFSDPS